MRVERASAMTAASAAQMTGTAALNLEAGRLLRRHLTAVVVAGGQFEVLAIEAAVRVLVLDADVRKLHAVLHDGQAVRIGPRADLLGRPVRSS